MVTARCRGVLPLALALLLIGAASAADEASTQPAASPEGTSEPAGSEEPDPLFDEGAAEPDEDFDSAPRLPDPLEPANRAFFRFNDKLDDWFWSPLNRAYRAVAPEPVREGIRRALHNLNTPVFVANSVLQLRFGDAAETLGAFVLNSTLGVLGFFEPSKEAGWEAHPADFGQTLDLVGVGSGPYLVIPILGPTTLRDGFGSAVDRFFQPLNYMLGLPTQLLWGGGAGLSTRDEASEKLEALEKSAVDFYSVLRSAYWQNRVQENADARARRNEQLAYVLPDSWWRAEQPAAEAAVPAHD
jgi:phospholipid-binding lipoprotein MlaA